LGVGLAEDANKIKRLERRIKREKAAREEAEELLNSKSLELYSQFQNSEKAKNELELALWATKESFWSWCFSSNSFLIKSFSSHNKTVEKTVLNFTSLSEMIHPSCLYKFKNAWDSLQYFESQELDIEFRVFVDNKVRWLKARGRVVESNELSPISITGTLKDISNLRQTESSFKLMSYAFSKSRDAMLILSRSLEIIEVNDAFMNMMGSETLKLSNVILSEFVELRRDVIKQLFESSVTKTESRLLIPHKKPIAIEVAMSEFNDEEANNEYIIATLRDLSERKIAEKKLHKLAHFDALTDLLNRASVQQRLDELLNVADANKLVCYFIDIDGFKSVNDTFGHDVGDQLLKKIASRLNDSLSHLSLLSRWGGDEFVVIYPNRDEIKWNVIAQQIVDCIDDIQFSFETQKVEISASVGVALFPEHGKDAESLLRHADAAMYSAKEQGKNRWQLYYKGLTDEAVKRVTMLSELKSALKNNTLDFVFQGKYDQDRKLIGSEVLCRWQSSLYGSVPPSIFIPIIEQNGLQNDLGICAIEATCKGISTLKEFGYEIPVSVNICATQVTDDNFLEQLISIVDKHQVRRELVEIEVTESVFMIEGDDPFLRLKAIQDSGFKISLDDFGTGYSALSYLRQFTFDVVKIDRSFLYELNTDDKALNLFNAILEMCRALKTKTIIEGVETEEQFSLLVSLGVEQFQGFLLGKPIPIGDFITKLYLK
jgi:diguanylate cyclase (GGDEF)-like protein/PAS domain S-box-containing protein